MFWGSEKKKTVQKHKTEIYLKTWVITEKTYLTSHLIGGELRERRHRWEWGHKAKWIHGSSVSTDVGSRSKNRFERKDVKMTYEYIDTGYLTCLYLRKVKILFTWPIDWLRSVFELQAKFRDYLSLELCYTCLQIMFQGKKIF